MDVGSHMLATFAAPRHGSVEVIYHDPLRVSDYPDRKLLARACEDAVRQGVVSRLGREATKEI